MDMFKTKGWKEGRSKKKSSSPRYEEPYKRKIVAIWITLHKAGIVRNGKDQALQAYVKRITNIENLRWCFESDCYPVIESLKDMAKRNGVNLD